MLATARSLGVQAAGLGHKVGEAQAQADVIVAGNRA